MKTVMLSVVGLSFVLLSGCCLRRCDQRYDMPQAQVAYASAQTYHNQDGMDVKRIMLWVDGEWWEVFKKDLKPK